MCTLTLTLPAPNHPPTHPSSIPGINRGPHVLTLTPNRPPVEGAIWIVTLSVASPAEVHAAIKTGLIAQQAQAAALTAVAPRGAVDVVGLAEEDGDDDSDGDGEDDGGSVREHRSVDGSGASDAGGADEDDDASVTMARRRLTARAVPASTLPKAATMASPEKSTARLSAGSGAGAGGGGSNSSSASLSSAMRRLGGAAVAKRGVLFAAGHGDDAARPPIPGSPRMVRSGSGGSGDGGDGAEVAHPGEVSGVAIKVVATALAAARKERALASGGSVGSGRSGQSDGSHLSPIEMIRRGVKARSTRLETSLATLRNSLAIVFLIVLITNLSSYAVSNVLTGQLLQNLDSLSMNSKRAVYATRAAEQVQKLVAHADMSLGAKPKYDLAEGESFVREKLRQAAIEVETLHKALYLEAEASGNAAWFEQYHDPSWTVMDLVPNTYVDRDHFSFVERNVSFSDLVLEYTMRLHSVWFYKLASFSDADSNVFWIARTALPGPRTPSHTRLNPTRTWR